MRLKFQAQCEDCELPYYEYVTADPTEDEMRAVVCLKVSHSAPCGSYC